MNEFFQTMETTENILGNGKNNDTDDLNHGEEIKYLSVFFNCLFMAVNIWLMISFTHYGKMTRKWQINRKFDHDKFDAGYIFFSLLFCTFFCFLVNFFSALYIIDVFNVPETDWCDIAFDLIQTMYALTIFSVMLFLWSRQRMLFAAPLPNAKFKKPVKFFSFIIIFFILIGCISAISFACIAINQISSPRGCVFRGDDDMKQLALIIAIISIVIGQLSLLFLFVYALRKIKRTLITANGAARGTLDVVAKMIKKTITFAALSIVFDTIVLLASLQLSQPDQRADLTLLLGSIDVVLNLIFVSLSFFSWRAMIMSPCKVHELRSFVSKSNI